MNTLAANKGETIRRWAGKYRVDLCFTPTCAPRANPIEAHFGPLRQLTIADSNYRGTRYGPGRFRPVRAGATPTPATPTSAAGGASAGDGGAGPGVLTSGEGKPADER